MSDASKVQNYCKVVNKHGLHTRSASAIVALANQFQCAITISSVIGESDARDMIRLMLLEASQGNEICISAEGVDAEEAVSALSDLVAAGFYEKED